MTLTSAVVASRGRLWLLVWVIPIKDPKAEHRGYPTPIARRHDGAFGADPATTREGGKNHPGGQKPAK